MANVPLKLGPYEPLHRLGAGGMAETFLAVRRGPAGFEQRVCIKRILPAYESDQEFVASFLEEARTSAALRHANIVQVVDFGVNESDGSHYLALELVDGLDLRALIQRENTLDAELVTLIALELSAALAHAHSEDEGRASVVHRDLSPSNVLVSRAGEVKLTDFGIARVLGGSHRTASGVIKGKVPYMPPEYIDGGRFDTRGDLFSLGVLLFELCHGRRPFDGDSEIDTMRRIVAGDRRPFEARAPRGLIDCVDRLLQRQPTHRFDSAASLLDALPPISVHGTRKRLASLVRGRPSSAPPELAATFERSSTPSPRTLPFSPTEPRGELATRTAPRSRSSSLRASLPALVALGAAIVVLTVVASLVLLRNLRPASASVPRLPIVPASAALPRAPPPTGPSTRQAEAIAEPESALAETVRKPEAATRSPAPRSTQLADLRVVVYPFGDVWVDDKYAGQSPLSLRLTPGTHEIAIGEGRARERKSVRLKAGENESLTFRPTPAAPL